MAALQVDVRAAIEEEHRFWRDLDFLLQHYSVSDVARGLGIRRETLYPWMARKRVPEEHSIFVFVTNAAARERQSQPQPSLS